MGFFFALALLRSTAGVEAELEAAPAAGRVSRGVSPFLVFDAFFGERSFFGSDVLAVVALSAICSCLFSEEDDGSEAEGGAATGAEDAIALSWTWW